MTVPDTSATTPTHITEALAEHVCIQRAGRGWLAECRCRWKGEDHIAHLARDVVQPLIDERTALLAGVADRANAAGAAAEGSLASLLADLDERLGPERDDFRWTGELTLRPFLRALVAKYTPDTTTEEKPMRYLDKTTLEPCPTRGSLLCTITDGAHRHIAEHMVGRTAPDAATPTTGGTT